MTENSIVIHPVSNESVFSLKTAQERYVDLLKRNVHKRITKAMTITKDITEFQRTETIDCDIIEFFHVFGHLGSYLYKKNKRPRKVHKDHIRKINDPIVFEKTLGYPPPTRHFLKKDMVCSLVFPVIICYSAEEQCVLLDIKYKVTDAHSGREIVKLTAKSSRARSLACIKELAKIRPQ